MSFIESQTLFVTKELWARVGIGIYTYTNNFFMSNYMLDFGRKIYKPTLAADAVHLPLTGNGSEDSLYLLAGNGNEKGGDSVYINVK